MGERSASARCRTGEAFERRRVKRAERMSFARRKVPCAERAQPGARGACRMFYVLHGERESASGYTPRGRGTPRTGASRRHPTHKIKRRALRPPIVSTDAPTGAASILWKTVSGRDEASLLRLPSRAPLFFCACVPLRRASPRLLRLRLLLRFRRRIALSPVVPLQAHAGWVGSFEFRSSRNPVQSRP